MGQKEEEGPPKLNSAACSTQLVLASGTLVAAIFQSRTCRILPRAGARRGHTSSEPGWVVHDPTGSSDEPERERERYIVARHDLPRFHNVVANPLGSLGCILGRSGGQLVWQVQGQQQTAATEAVLDRPRDT